MISQNGVDWTISYEELIDIRAVGFGAGNFIVIGRMNYIKYSSDGGNTWLSVTTPASIDS